MKLVQGATLSSLIESARRQAEAEPRKERVRLLERLDVFLRICDALCYAHSKRVLHRDLKPDNIMVGRYNEVYVMDWGICRLLDEPDELAAPGADSIRVAAPDKATRVGAVLGTPAYMSPEQAAGRNAELDGRSDLYALGLILQELVTLKLAVPAPDAEATLARATRGERDAMEHFSPHLKIDRELKSIVAKACAPHVDDRYPVVKALAEDLRRYLHNEATLALPDGPLQALARWGARRRGLMLGLFAAFVFLAVAALVTAALLHQRRIATLHQREARLESLLLAVSRRAHAVDNHWHRFEQALTGLAAHATDALAMPVAAPARVYFASDFDSPSTAPRELMSSPLYYRPISTAWPVFNLAPGVSATSVRTQIDRLAPLVPAMADALLLAEGRVPAPGVPGDVSRLFVTEQTAVLRVFVALESGVQIAYPGTGGTSADYDPRLRPKYLLAKGTHGPQWGNPFTNLFNTGLVLPTSSALYDSSGKMIGVAGIEMGFNRLVTEILPLADLPAFESAFLVDNQARVVVHTGAQLYDDARRDAPPGRARDGAPLTLSPLPYPEVLTMLKSGMPAGQILVTTPSGPRRIAFTALDTLGWYYVVVVDEERFFL
jgi:serine/threonine-protein kinase